MRKERVVVAMSGGVDSSVAAYILIKQGYEVIGITMKLPNLREVSGCCWIEDARYVASKLGIPFYVINYEKEFTQKVIKYFLREYINGRTPNPCIICNERIKFGSLLNKAKELNADYIATGHYAKKEHSKKRYLLKKGIDKEHDQSYFLFSLSQRQLSSILFPLGDYTKKEVRQLAKELGLKVHSRPSSQEICFIPDNDYKRFIRTQINCFKRGSIVDSKGNILGEHQGIPFYTIGQRKGIGAYGKPYYVIEINKEKNTIVVGEEKELYKDTLVAKNVNLMLTDKIEVKAKIRYRHIESDAIIFPLDKTHIRVKFAKPQRAITPGQAIVFYDGDIVVGGGWIESTHF